MLQRARNEFAGPCEHRNPPPSVKMPEQSESVVHLFGRAPAIVANPGDDDEFASRAWHLIEAGADTPGRLESMLRSLYPWAVVRRRELSGEPIEIWYVYRDGHWVPPSTDHRNGEGHGPPS